MQRKLAEESGYDVRKYAELCHKIAVEAAAEYGLTLKYGRREGGEMEPAVPRLESALGWGQRVLDARTLDEVFAPLSEDSENTGR